MTSSQVIPFVKATACGNDFVIVEGIDFQANLPGLSKKLCNRSMGVGADGVEWLFADPRADIQARLFNSDGSEAEISGNGTRCVAAYLCSKDYREKVVIRTGAGLKACTLVSRDRKRYEFEIAMGEPVIGDQISIPVESEMSNGLQISMGNPHFVSIISEFPRNWQALGAEIQRSNKFPQGTNVEFVVVENESAISVKFFERGVGETQSSGTGSCAAAVAAIATGKVRSPVEVRASGGNQAVRWEKEVFLTGSATLLFRGWFFL